MHLSTHTTQASVNAPLSDTRLSPLVFGPTWTLLRQCRLPIGLRWRRPHQLRSLRPRQHFCVAPCAGWLMVHSRRHHGEVCPLSGGVMSQPLSVPLQVGICFLPDPLPAAPSAHLATRFPLREDYGLTTVRN